MPAFCYRLGAAEIHLFTAAPALQLVPACPAMHRGQRPGLAPALLQTPRCASGTWPPGAACASATATRMQCACWLPRTARFSAAPMTARLASGSALRALLRVHSSMSGGAGGRRPAANFGLLLSSYPHRRAGPPLCPPASLGAASCGKAGLQGGRGTPAPRWEFLAVFNPHECSYCSYCIVSLYLPQYRTGP